jgi:Permuted papain-like amidase enzyme, YaeF/YiiX, C92 family
MGIKAGDILFVRGHSPLSRVIRLFDKGEFSHVAIALSDTHILEAQYYTKTRITPIYFDDYEVISLDLPEHELLKISIQLVGKWYDYLQIVGYMVERKTNNPNQLICSELVASVLYSLGEVEDYEEVKDLTPNELYQYLLIHKDHL